jgi:hypothetical protein
VQDSLSTKPGAINVKEISVSTKIPLKYHKEDMEGGIGGFYLYRECFDDGNTYVYLEATGVPFTAANTAYLDTGKGLSSIAIRLPEEWARKLGLIGVEVKNDEQD